jgi:hypothetical protein
MTQVHDHSLPASSVLRRLENHLEGLRADLAATPRWRFKRRLILSGACSAYRYEIDELLRITGSWQPIWPTRPTDAHVEPGIGIRRTR